MDQVISMGQVWLNLLGRILMTQWLYSLTFSIDHLKSIGINKACNQKSRPLREVITLAKTRCLTPWICPQLSILK